MNSPCTGENVAWVARVHAGEFLHLSDELPLLSTRRGRASQKRTEPSDDVEQCLISLLADLTVSARHYRPLSRPAKPMRFMTVFVEQVCSEGKRGAVVARFDIVCGFDTASAGAVIRGSPRVDIGPVLCGSRDGVWEITQKLLSAMFPKFSVFESG